MVTLWVMEHIGYEDSFGAEYRRRVVSALEAVDGVDAVHDRSREKWTVMGPADGRQSCWRRPGWWTIWLTRLAPTLASHPGGASQEPGAGRGAGRSGPPAHLKVLVLVGRGLQGWALQGGQDSGQAVGANSGDHRVGDRAGRLSGAQFPPAARAAARHQPEDLDTAHADSTDMQGEAGPQPRTAQVLLRADDAVISVSRVREGARAFRESHFAESGCDLVPHHAREIVPNIGRTVHGSSSRSWPRETISDRARIGRSPSIVGAAPAGTCVSCA
jgi:hypothetical protein